MPNIEIILKSRTSYKNKELREDKIILRPEDYIIDGGIIKNNLYTEKDSDFSDLMTKNECQPAFMPIDVPAPRGPIFVFGEYFLRKFYTVFDRDENVLGFSIANEKAGDVLGKIQTPYDTESTQGEGDGLHGKIKEGIPKAESKQEHLNMNIPNGALSLQTEKESDSEFFKNVNMFDESLENIDNEIIAEKVGSPMKTPDFLHEKEKIDSSLENFTIPF